MDYIHVVQYYETDKMGITHHSNYIRWMEEARIDFLSQIGWDYAKLEASGVVSPVLSVTCDYKKITSFADRIRIRVSVKEFKGVKLHLAYEMWNEDDKVVCLGTSSHAFLSADGKPIRLKQEQPGLYETLSALVSEDETVKRISEMELILDETTKRIKDVDESLQNLQDYQPEIERLEEYYSSKEWKEDLAKDEEGALPKGLRRGVLSEDGIYNVLEQWSKYRRG